MLPTDLIFRVSALEECSKLMQAEIGTLRLEVCRIEARSVRGESLLMEMQRDQRRMSKVIDSIALALKIIPPPVTELTKEESAARAAEMLANSEEEVAP